MAEIILQVIKWSAIVGFFAGSVLSFIALMIFVIGMLATGLNAGVVGDLIGIVQMYAPFNIGLVLGWAITASGLYLTYKVSLMIFNYATRFMNA
jgi:hypothetical protein